MTLARVTKFVRSLLPADPFQLLFLAGLVCLSTAPHLRWWPTVASQDLNPRYLPMSAVPGRWVLIVRLVFCAFYFAAGAGYFLCLWPTRRARLRAGLLVALPATLGVSSIVILDAGLWSPYSSVLDSRLVTPISSGWVLSQAWQIGSGLHYALLGLLFAIVFLIRNVRNEVALPLRLAGPVNEDTSEDLAWSASKRLMFVALTAVTTIALGLPMAALVTAAKPLWTRFPNLTGTLLQFFEWSLLLGIFAWAMGSQNRDSVLGQLRFGKPKLLLAGVMLPILVTLFLVLARYQVDRFQWATYDFGRFNPPQLQNYFSMPAAGALLLVFAAFAEEVAFRGALQRQFVRRYGVRRGIVLVGMVWAAFHFVGDRYLSISDFYVALGISQRIAQCVIFGVVLSWLTLRSGSLWPATCAHWLSNVGFEVMDDSVRGWWRTVAWLPVVIVICKYSSAGEKEIKGVAMAAADGHGL